jgi:GNAT superfamily N-acetyltransferase
MADPIEFNELTTPAEIATAYDVMAVLRPHVPRDAFAGRVVAQQRDGYRLIGGLANGRIVTVAGFRFALTLARGPHLFVDDLVTAADEQGKGYGAAMLEHLKEIAAERGMSRVWLDSRETARTFYEKVGFTVHTSLPCWIDVKSKVRSAQ